MTARPPWLNTNFTEPRVIVAVRDLCAPHATVFDVGANFGGISVAMSRTVGPRGAVCAFEANPAIAARCQTALNESGCGNSQVYHAAIYSRSRESISLYLSDNMVADSIHYKVSDRTIDVPTLALDDFVDQTKLVPQFVKMDIEGAEIDALEGFEKTIRAYQPVLVLEQIRTDNQCLEFLRKHGYSAFDLSTYTGLDDVSQLPVETVVTDILYAPSSKLEGTPYRPGTTAVASFDAKDFERTDLIFQTAPFKVTKGRYIVQALFSGASEDRQEMYCGVSMRGEPLMRHHGHSDSLCAFTHRWVFDAPDGDLSIFFQFARECPESFKISHVAVSEVDAFRGKALLFN